MSNYIGSSDAEKIYPENTIDFIVIQDNVSHYYLSQDVPGAYEANVLVIKNNTVLQPELDYGIGYSSSYQMNNELTFNCPVTSGDNICVIHKGVATYNMVPSPRSVTDDSISENLRDFVFETFTGDGGANFTLAKPEHYARSLLVTVDGVLKKPEVTQADPPQPFDYSLVYDENTDTTELVFSVAPSNGAVIGVLHLAFSTVLRRSDYLTKYVISNDFIETGHIKTNAVTGAKIRLNNDEPLRSLKAVSGESNLIKLNTNDQAVIDDKIFVDSANKEVFPDDDALTKLGRTDKRFSELHAAIVDATNVNTTNVGTETLNATGNVACASLEVIGSFTVGGSVVGTLPVGTVVMYYGNSAPAGWLMLTGGTFDQSQFPALFAHLGTNQIPNMRGRLPIGIDPAGNVNYDNAGETGGSVSHDHSVQDHDHNLTSTNVTITDSPHSHILNASNNIIVDISGHSHALAAHNHTINSHTHRTEMVHYHSFALTADMTHGHWIGYRQRRVVTNPGEPFVEVPHLTNVPNFKYDDTLMSGGPSGYNLINLASTGTVYGSIGSGGPNLSTLGPSSKVESMGSQDSGNPFGTTWQKTLEGQKTTGPSFTSTESQTISGYASGTVSEVSTISPTINAGSKTEAKTGLFTNSGGNLPPYMALNFIIKAV
jgi:microcystin-dependent protein